jgi:hypothetical protein
LGVVIEAGMALAGIETACKGGRELSDEPVIVYAEVAELEGKADEVGDEVGSVDAAVDKD